MTKADLFSESAFSALQWVAAVLPDQSGRTAIVTGANRGLGFLTAQAMAHCGAHVVMTARDERRGRNAMAQILATRPRGTVELRFLDLADLVDVRRFAEKFLHDGLPLDVLVNNAGVMMVPHGLTRQGYELQFGVNHLAHFLLTALLLKRLAQSRDGRVVTVTSSLHKEGRIRFDDLHGKRRYGPVAFYAQSKLANALFSLELDRRVRAVGLPVRSVLAHPGFAATNVHLNGPTGLLGIFMKFGNRYVAQSPAIAVLSQLYAAMAPSIEGGQFFGPNGEYEVRGLPCAVEPAPAAKDAVLAHRLWALSEQLIGEHCDPAVHLEA
ncbi:MAG: oxidoreductase [Kiloniellaceae bacterium]